MTPSKIALLALSAALLIAPQAGAEIRTDRNGGVWTVSAEGERLSAVLAALQAEAGFRLVGADRLIVDPPVHTEVTGDLDTVLSRLLSGRDYALVYGETPETTGQVQRVVLLTGRAGSAPNESHRLTATRLPPASETSAEDAARVSAALQRQIQPLIEAEEIEAGTRTTSLSGGPGARRDAPPAAPPGGGATGDDLDAETQAQLAEATRRASQDLQALVNALRQHEDGGR